MNESRGIRNNNPGNVRRVNGVRWQGQAEKQADAEFVVFAEPKWGLRAIARVLISYQDKHAINTVRGIVNRWAPPVENDTGAYVDHVARRTRFGADEPLDVYEPDTMRRLVRAIVLHENGVDPYTDAQVEAGLVLAGMEPDRRPLAATRTVRGAKAAAAATVAGVALEPTLDLVQQLVPVLPALERVATAAPWVCAAAALLAIGWIVWARLDDRRQGLR